MRKPIIFKEEFAFTLAEVILTLTIVGSIASFTIPPLIQNIEDKILKTRWKAAFSIVSQATRRLANDNSGTFVEFFSNSNDVRDKLSTYLKVLKKCNEGTALGPNNCWLAGTRELSGNAFTWWDLTGYSRMILNNGITIAVDLGYANCTYFRAVKQNACADMAIDVNGFEKGPNTVGKDIFWTFITADGSLEPFGKPGDGWTDSDMGCGSNDMGFTCASQYLRQ